ncbi:uncharacterized protein LOC110253894 [Exaiptasia diaphana]|uniref:Uncharacterized protein n=1 Tax=Exaiptasia diaphana TaxID=2652724 RepID=A0A913YA01_EXADI|nr:uncharacterized protein LOC110253894 [Exaiptasia diaphana]
MKSYVKQITAVRFKTVWSISKPIIFIFLLVNVIIVFRYRYRISIHRQISVYIPYKYNGSENTSTNQANFQELQRHFRFHFKRERKARTDWWGILKPCFNNTDWGQVKPGWEKSQRTDASTSLIISQDIRPAREYSRLFIQTKTKDGRLKSFGGDSWRVYLRGPASVSATVFDHDNGTYEALFLLMEPGVYRVQVYLDYSLCDGLRNPPWDWFIKGNSNGKKQKKGSLGYLDDYLYRPLSSNLSITVQQPRHNMSLNDVLVPSSECKEYCAFLYDGYGRWIKKAWSPFLPSTFNTSKVLVKEASGTIVSYGDSLGLRFGNSMSGNPNIRKVYKQADYRYNWIYPIGSEAAELKRNDDLDIDVERIVSYIKKTLDQPSINTEHSTLVLNLGLHYAVTVNFSTYQYVLERVLDLFFANQTLEHQGRQRARYKTNIIWKTTSQIKKENAGSLNETSNRFFTAQRVQLFNAYATWRMCKAGIPVVDVHQVTLSYPPGPMDVVHYPNYVFKQAEDALANFKRFYNNNISLIDRTCIQ